jgi:hypothetical protein
VTAPVLADLAVTEAIPMPADVPALPRPGQVRYVVQLSDAMALTAAELRWRLQLLPADVDLRAPGTSETVLHHCAAPDLEMALLLAAEWSRSAAVRAGRQRVKILAVSGRATAQPREESRPPAPAEDARSLAGLVMAAQGGDVQAYGLLYDRTVVHVYACLRTRRDVQVAEALTAEVYLKALRGIRDADLVDPVGWLLDIAGRLAPVHTPARHHRPGRLAGWVGRLWHTVPGHTRVNTHGGY